MNKADVFIDQWSKEYTDEPETSWDDIFGRVLDEFMRYADDEASANEEGYTIQERRDLNMLDDYDIRNEFNEFVSWLDLSDFDTEENINATRGGKNMKKFIKASDGSEMVNMLYDLTQNMWFEPMNKFSDIVYNADEIIPVIDFDDCVEFGTNNGQELLIYDEVNGRKHIKYSCSMTTIFDELVITDVWDENGQVYECDYDAIYDELAEKNNFNGVESSTQRRGGKNMKRSIRADRKLPFGKKPAPKKAVKADELYPENYNDLGYEGLDDAVDALKRAIENAKVMLSTLEGIADEYDEWGGSTPTIEMFAGPDDAIDFAEEMNKIADKLYDLDLYCPLP